MTRGRPTVNEGKARMRDRWSREDAAPRLSTIAPTLLRLSLRIEERNGPSSLDSARYVRHIVVASAPAVFALPCTDPNCEDGGHDVTREVLRGLERGDAEISGESICRGRRGGEDCRRVLRFIAHPEYGAK